MKIRIKGNSVRYRLTQTEVARFGAGEEIRENTNFDTGVFSYALQKTDEPYITALFVNNTITLGMPITMADEWTNTNKVGFAGKCGELAVFIEKDFKCLDNVAEDQSDNYPNPLSEGHEQS